MRLGAGQRYWDRHARKDPMWAILTDPQKSGRRWDPEEFFATGVVEIEGVLQSAAKWAVPVSRRSALDFGCGLGRLTQPLAGYFDKVYGVDVSPGMLEQARRFNRKGDRCEFVWNPETHLRRFSNRSIDFIYSSITLQHVRPVHVRSYLKEFMRVLARGGLLLFQLPGPPICPYPGQTGRLRFQLERHLALRRVPPPMYMNGIERDEVVTLLERNGGRLLEIEEDRASGPGYHSFRYAVTLA